MDKDYLVACLFIICVKVLFIPMYHSTDMEVHRNWMAITHNVEVSKWYHEKTSPWTLDYPPLFAWFEYGLSFLANYFDPKMLELHNLDYISYESQFFMRISVIISDLVYVFAIRKMYNLLKQTQCQTQDDPWLKPEVVFAMLMLWNPGLLLVDNIHFQYNGFLNGFLFFSIAAMMQDQYLQAAFWFALLLNFKHLYLYLAPSYFVYLLKHYCFKIQDADRNVSWDKFSYKNFFKLSSLVGGIFLTSFWPFLSFDTLSQVWSRLFPVKRGLTHTYWAPNIWALCNAVDRIFSALYGYFTGTEFRSSGVTRGITGDYELRFFPTIHLPYTVILTLLSIMPFLYGVWKSPKNPTIFLLALIGCAFGSFFYGYHVHEKAILMITLPMTILAVLDPQMVKPYILLCSVGHFSLFPLLHESAETPVKIILLLLHSVYAYTSLKSLHKFRLRTILNKYEKILIAGLVIVQLFYSVGLCMLRLEEKLPFLPLMFFSVYCSIGVMWFLYHFYIVSGKIIGQSAKIKL